MSNISNLCILKCKNDVRASKDHTISLKSEIYCIESLEVETDREPEYSARDKRHPLHDSINGRRSRSYKGPMAEARPPCGRKVSVRDRKDSNICPRGGVQGS